MSLAARPITQKTDIEQRGAVARAELTGVTGGESHRAGRALGTR
jgi:hypothetical protein